MLLLPPRGAHTATHPQPTGEAGRAGERGRPSLTGPQDRECPGDRGAKRALDTGSVPPTPTCISAARWGWETARLVPSRPSEGFPLREHGTFCSTFLLCPVCFKAGVLLSPPVQWGEADFEKAGCQPGVSERPRLDRVALARRWAQQSAHGTGQEWRPECQHAYFTAVGPQEVFLALGCSGLTQGPHGFVGGSPT